MRRGKDSALGLETFDRVEFFDQSGWLVGQGRVGVKEGFVAKDGTPWLTCVSSIIRSGSLVVRADLVGAARRCPCWEGRQSFVMAGTLVLDIRPRLVRRIIEQSRPSGEGSQ